jgi:flagellar biosynthesis/type III secretory pathway M-ring protein FliF/YscJ
MAETMDNWKFDFSNGLERNEWILIALLTIALIASMYLIYVFDPTYTVYFTNMQTV